MPLVFEWDERKNRSNLKKHGVGFAEAALVFTNPLARIFAGAARDHHWTFIGEPVVRNFIYGAEARRRSYY